MKKILFTLSFMLVCCLVSTSVQAQSATPAKEKTTQVKTADAEQAKEMKASRKSVKIVKTQAQVEADKQKPKVAKTAAEKAEQEKELKAVQAAKARLEKAKKEE